MRILQITQKPQRRGPEILAQELNREFVNRGHIAKTAFLYEYTGNSPLKLGDDIMLHGEERRVAERLPGIQLGLAKRLEQQISIFEPDIVQLNGSRSLKYGALVSKMIRQRRWFLVYRNIDNPEYWLRSAYHRVFYRYLVMPQMDAVIAVSDGIGLTLRRLYGFDVPMVTIPYVVSPSRFSDVPTRDKVRVRLGVPLDQHVVLFVGNLSEQKRPDRFVRVIQDVCKREPNTEGWIVGDGPLRASVERQIRYAGISDMIKLYGYQQDMGPFYSAADIMLVTSDSDGVPTVVQEAGYMGLPTVATDVGGIPECIINGKTGYVEHVNDEIALSKRVIQLSQNPELRVSMGQAAKRHVEQHFSLDSAVQKHLDYYTLVRDINTISS